MTSGGGFVGEDGLELGDDFLHLGQLVEDLLPLQPGEALEPHVQDGLGLPADRQRVGSFLMAAAVANAPAMRPGLGLLGALGGPDELDDRVQVVQGDLQAHEDVVALLGLPQLEHGPPGHHLAPEADELLQDLAQGADPGLAVHDGQHGDGEGVLQLGLLVQLVEDDVAGLVLLQLHHEADALPLEPTIPGIEQNRSNKLASIQRIVRNLKIGASNVECVVVTHDFLCDPEFQKEITRYSGTAMLIADEVHDLGTSSFLKNPPLVFNYRLGLSATPIRQYDEAGTTGLMDYFGKIVFQFTLKEAIGKCLVPYNYYVHVIELMSDELEEWVEISNKLKLMGWKFISDQGSDGKMPLAIQRLLNRRRRVLEQAGSKITSLRDTLGNKNPSEVKHTLVYASDKGRNQLETVNRMLMDDLKLRIHQITQEETGQSNLTQDLLSNFARGDIQVLTAMRVLDEGVDIPEVSTAFILASTTVERQWVQRRGRVLRKCARINKQIAYIHDFLVIPPQNMDLTLFGNDVIKILKAELERVSEFAKLSRNAAAPDGALLSIRPIIEKYF